ncbi:MAG: ribulose-phosphate 3-epimerase [Candidatus Bipolaricaulota bacterium]
MKLAPSLLSADFARLLEEALSVLSLASRFHWDVMDGHFVPNLTFGPPVVNALRDRLPTPFDIHLMIDRPAQYAPRFRVIPGDRIIFHLESEDAPQDALEAIRSVGAGAGICLRPGTPLETVLPWLDEVQSVLVMSVEPGFGGQTFLPQTLGRIRDLAKAIGNRPIEIAVDGGIGPQTARAAVEAGAEVLVAGSAIFSAADRLAAMKRLWEAAA